MKSDFMMAINQVCHERQLPLETVMEAVEVALASAYKRNYGANQITAKVDTEDGSIIMLIEKEVVEDLFDSKNEVLLEDARAIDPEAEIGGVIYVEERPENFGRIAAQTTKQVILQRIREAERDALYSVYAEREGEIVNGTVHKVDSHQVILSLGKVEAVLPRSEQIPTERYSEGQRLRAYVSEVSKTPRGPQIVVSRTHRNMLRRLLEVEVPEIYNGTVEIKAIAREAGYRSKVAVAALQEGVDPVGSCVGMRGVRIQSIVNELGGEKIDVAEWSPDTKMFISNALSPAKVLNVLLYDLDSDKTAMVVVPDKQLSLAIGKEGQNARLAAKLTNWRIDIKSAIEAAKESIAKASASSAIKARVSDRPEVFALAASILEENQEGAELSQGELQLLSEAIDLVGQAELAIEREKREAKRAAAEAERLAALEANADLLAEAAAILTGVIEPELAEDAEPFTEEEAELVADAAETETPETLDTLAEVPTEAVETPQPEVETTETSDVIEAVEELLDTVETQDALDEEVVEELEEAELDEPLVAEAESTEDQVDYLPSVLDSIVVEPEPEKPVRKLRIVTEVEEVKEEPESKKRRTKSKGRRLEYDEDLGRVVVKRQRKRSQPDWEDYDDDDF